MDETEDATSRKAAMVKAASKSGAATESDTASTKKRKAEQLDEKQWSACERVFRIPELVGQVFSAVLNAPWPDDDEIDCHYSWVLFQAHACCAGLKALVRCRRVAPAWNVAILNSARLQRELMWRPKDAFVVAAWAGDAGAPEAGFRFNGFLQYLVDHEWDERDNMSPLINGWATSIRIDVSEKDVRQYQTDLRGTVIAEMLLSAPPFEVFDIVNTGEEYETISGVDDDGHKVHRYSRLASHHKKGGFTMGDMMELVAKQFDQRKGLVRVAIKSMDHIKEKRIAMIEATEAVRAVRREVLERTDWSSIPGGDLDRMNFAQAWELQLEDEVAELESE